MWHGRDSVQFKPNHHYYHYDYHHLFLIGVFNMEHGGEFLFLYFQPKGYWPHTHIFSMMIEREQRNKIVIITVIMMILIDYCSFVVVFSADSFLALCCLLKRHCFSWALPEAERCYKFLFFSVSLYENTGIDPNLKWIFLFKEGMCVCTHAQAAPVQHKPTQLTPPPF